MDSSYSDETPIGASGLQSAVSPVLKPALHKADEMLGHVAHVTSVTAAIGMAAQPVPELHAAGAMIVAAGLIVGDLQMNQGRFFARAAHRVFGGVDRALKVAGVASCTLLGSVSLYRLGQSGQLANIHDPHWIITSSNLPFLASALLSDPRLRTNIEQRFGTHLKLAYKAKQGLQEMEVPRIEALQHAGRLAGSTCIAVFGHAVHSPTTQAIGLGFMAGPLVALGNSMGSATKAPGRLANMLRSKKALAENVRHILGRQAKDAESGLER